MKERRTKKMNIKLYEEKKKDGQTGRILIILDEPGQDLAEFVKKYVGSLGGAQKAIETVAPGTQEPVPEAPEGKPAVEVDTSKPAPVKDQAPAEEELFPDAPVPEPKKPAAQKQEAPKPAPAKQEPAPAAASAPADEARELWEMLDDDTKEEFLAEYGAGSFEDIEPDYIPELVSSLKERIFG